VRTIEATDVRSTKNKSQRMKMNKKKKITVATAVAATQQKGTTSGTKPRTRIDDETQPGIRQMAQWIRTEKDQKTQTNKTQPHRELGEKVKKVLVQALKCATRRKTLSSSIQMCFAITYGKWCSLVPQKSCHLLLRHSFTPSAFNDSIEASLLRRCTRVYSAGRSY
jgi:hypothetical protein